MRVIGLDPGLRRTGWGVIEADGARLRHLAHGVIETDAADHVGARLVRLHEALVRIIAEHGPAEAAVETSLVNKNPTSSLKLGQARGVVLLAPALAGVPVAEYLPNIVKKAVVGTGHAGKEQVQAMVGRLLPGAGITGADAADALAVAICHSHHASTRRAWAGRSGGGAAALAASEEAGS